MAVVTASHVSSTTRNYPQFDCESKKRLTNISVSTVHNFKEQAHFVPSWLDFAGHRKTGRLALRDLYHRFFNSAKPVNPIPVNGISNAKLSKPATGRVVTPNTCVCIQSCAVSSSVRLSVLTSAWLTTQKRLLSLAKDPAPSTLAKISISRLSLTLTFSRSVVSTLLLVS